MNSSLLLINICENNGLRISDIQSELLETYVDTLSEWNSKINLISRRDEENIWHRHILPSISLRFEFQLSLPSKMLDLGTGGGLPGIPIAILLEKLNVTLLDSIHKKIHALNDILSHLHLNNVTAICG